MSVGRDLITERTNVNMHPILAAWASWDSWSNVAFILPCMVPALVLLGFCIYNDARLRGEKRPVLWGVLSGVMFPAALVYFLVTRLAKPIELTCKFCGYSLSRWHTVCSSCGRLLVGPGKKVKKFRRRRKAFFILFILLLIAGCVTASVIGINMS